MRNRRDGADGAYAKRRSDTFVAGRPPAPARPIRLGVIGLRGLPGVIGGIETHCERLYPALVAIDPRFAVTLLIRRGYTAEDEFQFGGVSVRALWSPVIWGVDTLVHTFWALLYGRFHLGIDVVHLHGIGPGFFTPVARLLGLRVIVTHHAPDYERPKWGKGGRLFLRLGERFAAYFANAVVCVSQAVRTQLVAKFPVAAKRAFVIPNAGSLPDAGKPNDDMILTTFGLQPRGYILAVGRLEATKGFDILLAAYGASAAAARCKLVIVGSDTGSSDHAAFLQTHASDDIIFTGFQTGKALRRLYESAGIFVHPSRMEGYGLVVAEAISTGIPVIVSDITAHREFGLKERCFFAVGDVRALADALDETNYGTYRCGSAIARQQRKSWIDTATHHIPVFSPVSIGTSAFSRRRRDNGGLDKQVRGRRDAGTDAATEQAPN